MNEVQKRSRKSKSHRSSWRDVFALDVRSLAVFRIALGLTILADLAYRLPTLVAMYTDQGYMTRELVYDYYQFAIGNNWEFGVWSLHWFSGSAELQYALFGIAAGFAVLLTLGWMTRLATIASWVLLASLHVRNPLILTSGDTILKLVLFWSMFIPLGRVWSIDARGKTNERLAEGQTWFSMATVALILQIILMYFFTGVAKCNEIWFNGEAMDYVLRLDIYTLPLAETLLAYPLFLKIATYLTLVVELIVIWWLLSPKLNSFFRLTIIALFWSFHLGIGASMSIGLFPVICMMIWLPLLPSSLWQRFSLARTSAPKQIPQTQLPLYIPRWIFNSFCIGITIFVLLFNIANIENPVCQKALPGFAKPIGFWLNLDQRFQMFGIPPTRNPWFIYEGQMADGTVVDLVNDPEEVDHENRPEPVIQSLPTHHWRKLHRNLVNPIRAQFREPLITYMVERWNQNHDESKKIVKAKLFCYTEAIGPQYNSTDRQSTIWASYTDPNYEGGSNFDKISNQLLDENPEFPF